ncbi:type II toxin-antitoxin system YafQ family toxin [Aggregatibacter segnis]|jgi:addiction module toxin component, yafQ family|uniref:type II toxin-antitoxin system YafQ family toxin n=1 Tax=Aggregatibacter TaxID=416916 RepID=UPI000DAD0CCA|nr:MULTISPECIES: type II toxin-antitoxin system YafQ family toxin [Aggregatibacter]RDE67640.1 type II toxin-antitoxin system YafQ family toxin [Aggregatibacter segnis]
MKISFTKDYKRDLKRLANQPEILLSAEMIDVMHHLLNGKNLPEKYKDHALSGNWKGFRDCHIKNDLVLIYHVNNEGLTLVRLNTHSEVFR